MTAPAQNQTDHIVGSQVATSAQAPTATPAVRTAISKVLQAAVDWNLLEQNPARGICIGDRAPKTERLYLNPKEVGRLLASLTEPCRTLVLFAVLTGMRIGEILALRWEGCRPGSGHNLRARNSVGRQVRLAQDEKQQTRHSDEPTCARSISSTACPLSTKKFGRSRIHDPQSDATQS